MPLWVAFALGGNALPFLLLLLAVCIIALSALFLRDQRQVWIGPIWLGAAFVFGYCVYWARFSIGPLLIPSTALFAAAGLLALSWPRR